MLSANATAGPFGEGSGRRSIRQIKRVFRTDTMNPSYATATPTKGSPCRRPLLCGGTPMGNGALLGIRQGAAVSTPEQKYVNRPAVENERRAASRSPPADSGAAATILSGTQQCSVMTAQRVRLQAKLILLV